MRIYRIIDSRRLDYAVWFDLDHVLAISEVYPDGWGFCCDLTLAFRQEPIKLHLSSYFDVPDDAPEAVVAEARERAARSAQSIWTGLVTSWGGA